MKNISQEKAATLPIPLAPISTQQEFTRITHQQERLRAQHGEAVREAEQLLFGALLASAFGGEVP